jgi:hypothetical protein
MGVYRMITSSWGHKQHNFTSDGHGEKAKILEKSQEISKIK